MIFVTVGTHDQQFNRLVQAADNLAQLVDEPVVVQRGFSDFRPQFAEYFNMVPLYVMEEWIAKSRVVIAQAGAGTVITVLKQAKPLVVVPRLKKFGENYNDHQLELATVLDKQMRAVKVIDFSPEVLLTAIDKAETLEFVDSRSMQLMEALRSRLQTWNETHFWAKAGR